MTQVVETPPHAGREAPETPYVGLTPFTERDAPFFFGREKERRLIAANLLASRLTLLYGASGVGKSSVIRAGVQRDFRVQAEQALASGRCPQALVVVFTGWRDDPIAGLADCLTTSVREILGDLAPEPPPGDLPLDELLFEWVRRLDERARGLAGPSELGDPARTELLVVFDQFEQYFVYHPDEDGPGTFALEFPRAVNREGLRANFLISLREDAYTMLDRFEGRITNLFASNFRLEHLDEQAATAAIVKPVEKYNELLAPGEPGYSVEPELVEAVIEDVRAGKIVFGQAGGGVVDRGEPEQTRVETPFLQLVMTRLWAEEQEQGSHVLRYETLRRLGGAERIVRRHLDEAMKGLDEDERAVAARMFHQLVTPSGVRIVHSAADLAGYAEVPVAVAQPILRKLEEERILRTIDAAPGETTPRFEIRHDVLAGAVTEWDRQYEEARRRADDEVRRLKELEEERRRQRTRLAMRLTAGALIGFLVALALAIVAWKLRKDAQAQEHHSQSKELAVKAMLKTADDPAGSVALALEARDKDEHGVEAEGALRSALVQAPRLVIDGSTGARSGAQLFSAAFSPDGSRLLTTSSDGRVTIWRSATGERLASLLGSNTAGSGTAVSTAAFSPDGRRIVTAGADGSVHVLDAHTGREDVSLPRQDGSVTSASFSPDGRLIVTANVLGETQVWRAATGRRVGKPLRNAGVVVSSASFAGDGRRILTAAADGTATVWAADTGRRLVTLHHPGTVRSASVSPNGELVATAGDDGMVRIWDLASGAQPVRTLIGHEGAVNSVGFSPDGRFLVTAGDDATARVWDEATGRPEIVLHGHAGAVNSAAFSRDGKVIVTAGADGTARVWTAPERSPLRVLGRGPHQLNAAAFSPDGTLIVTAGADGTATLWQRATGEFVAGLSPGGPDTPALNAAAFSPDGRFVVTAAADGTARVWDAQSRRPLVRLLGHESSVDTAAFDAKGDRIVTASEDGTAGVWERSTGRRIATIPQGGQVTSASFSPDGKLVVTGGDDGEARIWDLSGKRDPVALTGHSGPIRSAAFSPDGSLVVTGSDDSTARVWDATTGASLLVLREAQPVNDASFSSVGSFVLTVSADGTARVWDVATGVSLAVFSQPGAGSLYGGSFSPKDDLVAVASDTGGQVYACDVCTSVPKGNPLGVWPPIFGRTTG